MNITYALSLAALVALAPACSKHSYVLVTVDGALPLSVTALQVAATNGGQTENGTFSLPAQWSLPQSFYLSLNDGRAGVVDVTVAAMAGAAEVARKSGTASILPGAITDLKLTFGAVAVDMASPSSDLPPDLGPVSSTDLPAAPAILFNARSVPVKGSAYSVIAADFNRDQKLDLAVAENDRAFIGILLGNGDGSFAPEAQAPTGPMGSRPSGLLAADADGDNRLDVVFGDWGLGSLGYLPGKGDGTFGSAVTAGPCRSISSIGASDFNADGMLDLVVTSSEMGSVLLFLSQGGGKFAAALSTTSGQNPSSLAVADLDGDGRRDVVTANSGGHDVSYFKNRMDGTFAPAVAYSAGLNPYSVAVSDMNEDGVPDLVVADFTANAVLVMVGASGGHFSAPVPFAAAPQLNSVATGDFNRDGHLDVVATSGIANQVAVLRGDGAGNLSDLRTFNTGNGPASLVVADLNGDGRLDVVTANSGDNSLTTLLNSLP